MIATLSIVKYASTMFMWSVKTLLYLTVRKMQHTHQGRSWRKLSIRIIGEREIYQVVANVSIVERLVQIRNVFQAIVASGVE